MARSVFHLSILLCNAFSILHAQVQIEEGTITNLCDAFGRNDSLTMDFGFSCLLKYGSQTILFDAGNKADIFQATPVKCNIAGG